MPDLLPTKVFHNFLSDDTLFSIRDAVDRLGTTIDFVHTWEGPKQGQLISSKNTLDTSAYPEVVEQLTSLLPGSLHQDIIAHSLFHLKSFVPYEIHSDWGWIKCSDDERPFYVFVIPLHSVNAKTIILDQTHQGLHFVDYKKTNSPLPADQHVSDSDFQQYFNHCWPQEQPYISIQTKFDWVQGSAVMFDARYLHLSDNYAANGVVEKHALVLMTKIKSNNFSKYLHE